MDDLPEEKLLGAAEATYGDKYRDHMLEQYKLYLGMADKISDRRQSANTFFLTVNSALVALFTVPGLGTTTWHMTVGLAGAVISYTWYRLIRSYSDINSGKFKVVHRVEAHLPVRLFDAEWIILGEGKDPKKYLPFSRIEMRLPWIFMAIYLVMLISKSWWIVGCIMKCVKGS